MNRFTFLATLLTPTGWLGMRGLTWVRPRTKRIRLVRWGYEVRTKEGGVYVTQWGFPWYVVGEAGKKSLQDVKDSSKRDWPPARYQTYDHFYQEHWVEVPE